MKVEQQRLGTVDVFTPCGPLLDQDGEKFCATLMQRIQTGNPRVVVNLSDVAYLDSTALEGLVDVADRFQERGSNLKIASASPMCREIFELTGVTQHFRFFKDVQDAVKSFL